MVGASDPVVARRQREIRFYQYGAFVLAAAALVAGGALLPRGDELLLIHVKNRQIERARELLVDVANQRVSSVAAVVAHHELYLLEGRVDEALEEMRVYAQAHPGDVAVWKRLVQMYAEVQRLDDHLAATEEVYRLEPSPPTARRLVTLYRWTGDERAEGRVLRDLVLAGHATSDEHRRAARIDAALGRPEDALESLERLRHREPTAFDYATAELYASVLLDARGPASLAGPIQQLPLVQDEPQVLPSLARVMVTWGRADAAVALFDVPPRRVAPPAWLATRARVATGTPAAARVARELLDLDAVRPLDPEPLEAVVDLLLSERDYGAVGRALTRPGRRMAPSLASRAIGHAIAEGARREAQALVVRLGDDSLIESPLLAIDLAVERDDRPSAERWIQEIDRSRSTTPDQIAALAQFEVRLGLGESAFDRLETLVRSDTAPVWASGELVQLAKNLGRVDRALDALASSRAAGASDSLVRLAASAGRTDLVESWLASSSSMQADPQALRDVQVLLSERGESRLAVMVASRLVHRRGDAADRDLLDATEKAHDGALLAALQSGVDVEAELRPLFWRRLSETSVTDPHRTLLVDGLYSVGERAALFDEIIRLAEADVDRWLSPLIESATSPERRERASHVIAVALESEADVDPSGADSAVSTHRLDLVRGLMTLGANDDLLMPHLRYMADAVGGTWIHAYDERLERRADVEARVKLWTAIGRSAAVPRDERRAAASKLVDLGARATATEVLQELAARSGPTDEAVVQLMAVWPSPPQTHLDWLTTRLVQAAEGDQAGWMRHLLQAGGSAGARHIVAALPGLPVNASDDVVISWIDAYRLTLDPIALDRAGRQVLARSDTTNEQLRHVARSAVASGVPALASRAFAALVEREPGDLESLRWLGGSAFADGRLADARRSLDAYMARGGDEPEALYQLGELAREEGQQDRARLWYSAALLGLETRGVETARDADVSMRALLANVLVRLDERQRARHTFAALLDREPTLDDVRADYVAALLQWGDFTRVGEVLAESPQRDIGGERAEVRVSGSRRLDLLRVQWLTHQGQYAAAQQRLERLALHAPADPQVWLARAAFEADLGRQADADRAFERARVHAPQHEGIERAARVRAQERSPRVALESSTRSITNGWDERSERFSLSARLATHTPIAMSVERLQLRAANVRGADGLMAPLDVDLRRVEAAVTVPVARALSARGHLFATTQGLGAGATLTHDALGGRTEVVAETGRPFWEFVEMASADGRRDRVSVQRSVRFRPDTAVWAQAMWNRYRIASNDRAQSAGLAFGAIRTVRRVAPTVVLQYGLDKERRLAVPDRVPADGRVLTPIPLVNREVHLFGAIGRMAAGRLGDVETTAGYTIDRLGGRGAFVTARSTPRSDSRVGLSLWADRRVYAVVTTQRVMTAGAQLTVRF